MHFLQKLFLKGYHHCYKTIPPISYYLCLMTIIICLGCSEECPDDPESNAPEPEEGTYVNPVIKTLGLADPSVIYYKGKYYLYPTGDSRSYDVYISNNLVNWEKGPKVFKSDEGKVWAPDVFHDPYDDQFIDILVDSIMYGLVSNGDVEEINYVASFVQNLDYKSDSGSNNSFEYPRYPVETLFNGDGGGDCGYPHKEITGECGCRMIWFFGRKGGKNGHSRPGYQPDR